ncbi:MAG: bacteriohemerythrin [Oligoflexia bacterium]|nr:bacteriohemerythrin [Oligoflexia bacterium]MBF0367178.1 bacteriohemerythrin [Oligoflexia bacterium]
MDSLPEQYRIGIPNLDEQHTRFLQIIEDVLLKIGDGKKPKELVAFELIQDLKKYSIIHFTYEEQQMKKIDWPNINAHKDLHHDFNKKILEYNSISNSKNEKNLSKFKELTVFLKDWFLNHIQKEDRKFAEYYLEKKKQSL